MSVFIEGMKHNGIGPIIQGTKKLGLSMRWRVSSQH